MLLGKVITIDGWSFECRLSLPKLTLVLARKTSTYGEKYSGVANIFIEDNNVNVEALHCDQFEISDNRCLRRFLKEQFQLHRFTFERFNKKLEKRTINRVI